MTEIVQTQKSEYMYGIIKKICVDVGPGIPASKEERARGMIIKDELETICDTVDVEEFTIAPNAYLGWFKLGVISMIIGYLFFYLSLTSISPIIFSFFAFLASVFIFLMLFIEFILEREFVDIFYPKRKSQNVIGKILAKTTKESSQPPKKILIFSGHHDSAFEFRWLRHFKHGYYVSEVILIGSVLAFIVGSSIWFFSVVFGNPLEWVKLMLFWLSITLMPLASITGLFFLGSGKNGGTVPGAIDNLSAVAVSLAVGKMIRENSDLVSPDTEIRIVSFGAEEAGVRGSRDYVTRHLEELKQADTMNINFETLYNPKISIFTSDRNGTLKHNPEFIKLVEQAAKNSNVPFRLEPFAFGGGGTDSMSFTEQKIKTVCLFGMRIPNDMVKFYHQCYDNYDVVNQETLRNALKIAIEVLKLVKN